mmetsp:Transcript_27593/g.41755  ORF Transcript_27593/g.41755 Transcript_27593/m.41755 type:complete len:91 (-) Transcript_27593:2356-2628(-)
MRAVMKKTNTFSNQDINAIMPNDVQTSHFRLDKNMVALSPTMILHHLPIWREISVWVCFIIHLIVHHELFLHIPLPSLLNSDYKALWMPT